MSTKCLKSKTSFSKTGYMKVFCFCSPAQFYISTTILDQIRGFIWSLNIKDGDRAITIVLMVTGLLNSIYQVTSTKNCVAALLILFFFCDLYSYFSCTEFHNIQFWTSAILCVTTWLINRFHAVVLIDYFDSCRFLYRILWPPAYFKLYI